MKIANIQANPKITDDKLLIFYKKTNICKTEFDKKIARKILRHPQLIVATFAEGEFFF